MSAGNVAVDKHRGIVLATPRNGVNGYYRVKAGRVICLKRIEALDREWLDAYVAWFKSRGRHSDAVELRARWLSARKVRA